MKYPGMLQVFNNKPFIKELGLQNNPIYQGFVVLSATKLSH